MKVSELMKHLEQLPGDAEIIMRHEAHAQGANEVYYSDCSVQPLEGRAGIYVLDEANGRYTPLETDSVNYGRIISGSDFAKEMFAAYKKFQGGGS